METLLKNWIEPATGDLLALFTPGSLSYGIVVLLVTARLGGFMAVGPFLGRAIMTWRVRVGLTVLLTLIIAPALTLQSLAPSDTLQVSHQEHDGLELDSTVIVDSGFGQVLSNLPGLLIGEATIGATLGLLVGLFLSGLKLAGEWLDRHSGLGLGTVLNPDYLSGESATAEMTWLFCMVVMLVLQPVNGHLLVVRFVLDTFRAIPVGTAFPSTSLFELIKILVQQSFILGLRIAMPFAVAMSLLDMTLGWARRSSRLDLAPMTFPLRIGFALLIIAATLPGISEAVSSSIMESFQATESQLQSRTELREILDVRS